MFYLGAQRTSPKWLHEMVANWSILGQNSANSCSHLVYATVTIDWATGLLGYWATGLLGYWEVGADGARVLGSCTVTATS